MEFITIINLLLLLLIVGMLGTVIRRHGAPQLTSQRKIVLDSCALIDGRIVELVRAGFLDDQLIVPRTVVAELQHLADHGDAIKRERARYGLDIVQQLQNEARVTISNDQVDTNLPVDEQLIAIAKQRRASLFTVDFNLNKVAQIEGVTVLNVNELSQVLRPHVLPGETGEVKIVAKGQDRQQGVGYQPDGTMVVVEHTANKIGKTVKVRFSRMLQTQAGRMLFADVATSNDSAHAKKPSNNNRRRGKKVNERTDARG